LAASPFDVVFTKLPANDSVAGDSGSVRLVLSNTSSTKYAGSVTIDLYASTDGVLSADDTLVGTLALSRVSLASGADKSVKVNFAYPADLSGGAYYLIASAATDANTADATAATPTTINVAAQSVDLAATFAASQAVTVTAGQQKSVAIKITNLGNVTAIGTLGLNLYAASGTTLDQFSQLLATVAARRITLKAGRSITIRVAFTAPNAVGGTYNLLASITATTQLADANAANNTAVIATQSPV
jgi:uncharacterized membrane protein